MNPIARALHALFPPASLTDGCGVPVESVTEDADIDALVLFADVDVDDPDELGERIAAYEELFGGS